MLWGGGKRKKLQHTNTVEPCAEVKGTDNLNSNKAKKIHVYPLTLQTDF